MTLVSNELRLATSILRHPGVGFHAHGADSLGEVIAMQFIRGRNFFQICLTRTQSENNLLHTLHSVNAKHHGGDG